MPAAKKMQLGCFDDLLANVGVPCRKVADINCLAHVFLAEQGEYIDRCGRESARFAEVRWPGYGRAARQRLGNGL